MEITIYSIQSVNIVSVAILIASLVNIAYFVSFTFKRRPALRVEPEVAFE